MRIKPRSLTVGMPTITLRPKTNKSISFRNLFREGAMRKLFGLGWATAMLGAALAGSAVAQEAPKSIKIGYVISLSGPQSAGAMLTTVPNYRLWVDEINKAGGLMLKKYNKRVPIEVSEIDDRSN